MFKFIKKNEFINIIIKKYNMNYLLNQEINKYNKNFEELIKIKVGDKPYYVDDKIKLSETSSIPYFQTLTRTLFSLNRNDFLEKFTEDVKNIYKLYQSINKSNNMILLNLEFYSNKTNSKIKGLINQIFNIIEILKKTYQEDKEFVKKLDNLQNLLI